MSQAPPPIRLVPLTDIPRVGPGDDLATLIAAAAALVVVVAAAGFVFIVRAKKRRATGNLAGFTSAASSTPAQA